MATVRPTKKQRELLDYIEDFIAEHGYSPSYREIMNGLQYNSVATVALHVGNLIKRGHLRKRDHSARSLEVVRNPANDPAGPDDVVEASPADHEAWLQERVESYMQQYGSYADGQLLVQALDILGLSSQAEQLQAALSGVDPQKMPANHQKAV